MNALDTVSWKIKAIAAVAVVVLIAGAGAGIAYWATSTSYDADIANMKSQHADERAAWDREKTAIATKAQQDTAAAMQRQHAAQDAAAAADKAAQEKLSNVQSENAALRRAVADGTKRVRILEANIATTKLAAGQHATGGDTGGSCLGDAVQIEFSAAGQRNILDLRESTQRDAEVIDYLQNYITNVVKQCKR